MRRRAMCLIGFLFLLAMPAGADDFYPVNAGWSGQYDPYGSFDSYSFYNRGSRTPINPDPLFNGPNGFNWAAHARREECVDGYPTSSRTPVVFIESSRCRPPRTMEAGDSGTSMTARPSEFLQLLRKLRGADEDEREEAARTLGERPWSEGQKRQARGKLERVLPSEPNPSVRQEIIRSLVNLGDGDYLHVLSADESNLSDGAKTEIRDVLREMKKVSSPSK